MSKKHINGLFDVLTPTSEQKDRLFHNITVQKENSQSKSKSWLNRPMSNLAPIAACLMLIFAAGAIANAATGGAIWDGSKRIILMASGGEWGVMQNGTFYGSENTEWAVRETWGKIILEVDDKKINITKELKTKGFYHYEYVGKDDFLHNIVIAKNNGEEGTERWYSQSEWLPDAGMGTGKGVSGTLNRALIFAGYDVDEGIRDYDSALKYRLQQYWDGKLTKLWDSFLDEKCTLLEDSVQTIVFDENEEANYIYSNGTYEVNTELSLKKDQFEFDVNDIDRSRSESDENGNLLYIIAFRLEKDGSVTGMVYMAPSKAE